MIQKWELFGKKGNIVFPKGEVVYQTRGVVVEPIFETEDGDCYIFDPESEELLLPVLTNPFNGYCYRQDGK